MITPPLLAGPAIAVNEAAILEPKKKLQNLNKAGDLQGAYEATLEFIAQDPQNSLFRKLFNAARSDLVKRYFNDAVSFQTSKNFGPAMENYRRVLSLDVNDPAPYGNMGLIYLMQGDWRRSLEYYQKALQRGFTNRLDTYTAHYNLGLIFFQQEAYRAAAQHFHRALLAKPGDTQAKEGEQNVLQKAKETASAGQIASKPFYFWPWPLGETAYRSAVKMEQGWKRLKQFIKAYHGVVKHGFMSLTSPQHIMKYTIPLQTELGRALGKFLPQLTATEVEILTANDTIGLEAYASALLAEDIEGWMKDPIASDEQRKISQLIEGKNIWPSRNAPPAEERVKTLARWLYFLAANCRSFTGPNQAPAKVFGPIQDRLLQEAESLEKSEKVDWQNKSNTLSIAGALVLEAKKIFKELCQPKPPDSNPKPLIQAVYTMQSDSAVYERVFKKDKPFLIVVVVRHPENKSFDLDLSQLHLEFFKVSQEGAGRKEEPVPYSPNQVSQRSPATGFWQILFETNLPDDGQKYVVKASWKDDPPDTPKRQWEFYIDSFGPPPVWLRTGSAIQFYRNFLGSGYEEKDQPKPYEIFNPSRTLPIFRDLKLAGIRNIFISFEYYNFGRLEGGLKDDFGHWESILFNKGLFYWFPTGPTAQSFHYTTPPLDLPVVLPDGAAPEQRAQAQKEKIAAFVSAAHDAPYQFKVTSYMDIMGVYDPNQEVTDQENLRMGGISYSLNRRSTSQYQPEWVRRDAAGNPVRLNFTENRFGDPRYFWGLARTLNPNDYAVTPDFGKSGADSYRSYLNQQVKEVVDAYSFDGIFFDDIGRAAMNCGNITATDPLINAAIRWLLESGEGCSFDEEAYIFGVDPGASDFGQGYTGDLQTELGQTLSELRQTLHQEGDRFLLSANYYVPHDILAAATDISGSDQYDLQSDAFAKWAYHTFEKHYKGLRLDYNPRTKTDLTTIGIAWANRGSFWFGGDQEPNPIADLITKTTCNEAGAGCLFAASPYGRYAKWHSEQISLRGVGPWKLLHHSRLKEDQNENGMPYSATDEIVYTGSPAEPYFVLYSTPGKWGEDSRILHIIHQGNGKVNYDFDVKIPAGLKVNSVRILSPDGDQKPQNFKGPFTIEPWGPSRYLKLKRIPSEVYTVVQIYFTREER